MRAQQAPAQHGARDLRPDFDETTDNVFSPVINLAEAAILMQSLPDSPVVRQIQRLTRDALHQIGKQQNPVPSASRNSRTPARNQENKEASQGQRPRGHQKPRHQDESHQAGSSQNRDHNNFDDARDIVDSHYFPF